jgi:hypothetical protein
MSNNFKETKGKKCCGKCPFKRGLPPTEESLGYSDPLVYIGQTRGPFWLPCHSDRNYEGKGSDISLVDQCRGAAIFRSNCEIPHKLPDELLKLNKDSETVFANEREFLEHYYPDLNEMELDNMTEEGFLNAIMNYELNKRSETKRYIKK